jgi:hypothetical protein
MAALYPGAVPTNISFRSLADEQELDAGMEPWVEVATAEGGCLAVTGSGLADTLAAGDWRAIEEAQREERLLGGVVLVVQE